MLVPNNVQKQHRCVFFVALLLSSAKVVGMAIKLAIESCDQAMLGVDITIQKCALNLFKGYVRNLYSRVQRLLVRKHKKSLATSG